MSGPQPGSNGSIRFPPPATHSLTTGTAVQDSQARSGFWGEVLSERRSLRLQQRRASRPVPSKKALYFPILNSEDSAIEERLAENPGNPKFQQISALRAGAESNLTNPSVSCSVDGAAIPQLPERYRVQSTAFSFTLPAGNLWTSIYGTKFPEGTYFPGVDDGWLVMLAPLHPGNHVLQLEEK